MKKFQTLKSGGTEKAFSAALIIIVLFVLPPFGGTAIVVGSAIGLAAMVFLFPHQFRNRKGSLQPAMCSVVALALLAFIMLVFSLIRDRWD